MRIKKNKYYFLLAAVISFGGCSGKSSVDNPGNILLKPVKINSWVDYMPGKRPAFYLSGEARLINTSGKEIKNFSFDALTIYRNDKMIYWFIPEIKLENKKETILPGDSLLFNFRNAQGLPVKEKFDFNTAIDILIKLNYDSTKTGFIIKDIKVEKVY